jgi:RNA polymerase sigma-70 factor (ECF subfamily)
METLLCEQIRQHGQFLFRLAIGVLHDGGLAEDVCQQAFLKAWDQRDRLRDSGALRGWLAKVVLNESFQILRRRKTENKVLSNCCHSDFIAGKQEEDFENRELILGALEKLPETTRMVITLRIMQQFSGNEVKELLGCSAAEVSRRLHEGMERLRELLVEQNPSGGGSKR